MIENSALIFENMSVVFINFKNINLFRFLGSHDLLLHFRPYNVYFFEFNFDGIFFFVKIGFSSIKIRPENG
jgi:hypothetical protein